MRAYGVADGAFAVFSFPCPTCGHGRKFYITPPHPLARLPRRYQHTCPDCGGGISYVVSYDERGLLFVDIAPAKD